MPRRAWRGAASGFKRSEFRLQTMADLICKSMCRSQTVISTLISLARSLTLPTSSIAGFIVADSVRSSARQFDTQHPPRSSAPAVTCSRDKTRLRELRVRVRTSGQRGSELEVSIRQTICSRASNTIGQLTRGRICRFE